MFLSMSLGFIDRVKSQLQSTNFLSTTEIMKMVQYVYSYGHLLLLSWNFLLFASRQLLAYYRDTFDSGKEYDQSLDQNRAWYTHMK